MNHSSEVIVIGLGAMGSSTVMHLASRGCRVRAFDQFTPPHNQGSSHGRSRIYRQAYFEDSRYVPMLLRARELWLSLEREIKQQLLYTTGGLVVGRTGGDLVARSEQSARMFDLEHEMLDAAEIKRRYPVMAVTPDTVALLEQKAGYLIPEECIAQQLSQAARHGAELHLDEPVVAWEALPGHDGVTVRTTRGEYSAGRVVITAGPWAPQILAELRLPLRVTRQVLYWFAPKGSIADFRPDRLPVYLLEAEPGQPLVYGFPLIAAENEGVKVALHGTPEVCAPETVNRELLAGELATMRARLATTVPALDGRLLRTEVCLYTMTPDEHFIIDQHPLYPAVTLAAGFSGHGFKFASVVGEALADRATTGRSAFDLGLFSIQRFWAAGKSD